MTVPNLKVVLPHRPGEETLYLRQRRCRPATCPPCPLLSLPLPLPLVPLSVPQPPTYSPTDPCPPAITSQLRSHVLPMQRLCEARHVLGQGFGPCVRIWRVKV